MWKVIWSLSVPNLVKVFLWKVGHNILPTMANLYKRRVVEEPLCPCCKLEEETITHALWTCPAARDVWGSGPRIFQKSSAWGSTFLSMMEGFLCRFNGEDMALMAVLAHAFGYGEIRWCLRVFSLPHTRCSPLRLSLSMSISCFINPINTSYRMQSPPLRKYDSLHPGSN